MMMKLVVFLSFCLFFSGMLQVNTAESGITTPNGKILVYAGDPFTAVCDETNALWVLKGDNLASCICPSSRCTKLDTNINANAFCNGSNPVLHFSSTKLDNRGSLKCSLTASESLPLLVGSRSNQFHPEDNSPFALVKKDYTLVYDKNSNVQIDVYNERERITIFLEDCYEFPGINDKNIDVTCETNKVKLKLKQVTLNDDGKIFGCETSSKLYLFTLTVNVPVTSLLLQSTSKNQIEGENEIFVCKVEESKPEATFQWKIYYRNGTSNVIEQKSVISKKRNGKVWQTISTLTLELKRSYHKIWCQAKIENMPWTNSDHQILNIKYPPPGKPRITVSKSPVCTEEEIKIDCKWPGGYPEADIKLTCLSQEQRSKSSVSITNKVTREMKRTCTCEGIHIAKNLIEKTSLNIHYPPKNVIIDQTSYLETKPAFLICNALDGYPADYTYSWSPRNFPSKREIKIDMTQFSNGEEITCTVNYKCNGNKSKSSTVKVIVENYPVIKIKDNITVIENEKNKLSCPTEGNPTPTNEWKIGNNVIKSKLLKVSFTRHNASGVQCIGIANSTKHGVLKSYKNISIVVLYPPEITITNNINNLHDKAEIICEAKGRPNNITYKMVQKWGEIKKRTINSNMKHFANISYQDMGTWICQASNDIPKKGHYIKKSVEVKVNVSAEFDEKHTTLKVGSKERIKVCFYCHPKATDVKWYKGNEEISNDKVSYAPAVDGLFPFTGNCSFLELEVNEKTSQTYYLKVSNLVGLEVYEITADPISPSGPNIYIIMSCVISVLIIFVIIGAIVCVKYIRSSTPKTNVDPSKSASKISPPKIRRKRLEPPHVLPSTAELDENHSFYDTIDPKTLNKNEEKNSSYVDLTSLDKNQEKNSSYVDLTSLDKNQENYLHVDSKPINKKEENNSLYVNVDPKSLNKNEENNPSYVNVGPKSLNKNEENNPSYVNVGPKSLSKNGIIQRTDI